MTSVATTGSVTNNVSRHPAETGNYLIRYGRPSDHAETRSPLQHDRPASPPSPTTQTNRTNSRRKASNIYDMTFEAFVQHLVGIYGQDAVTMMLNGLALIDASGKPPAIPWPEQQQPTTATTDTKAEKHIDFSDDLDDEDLAGDVDPDLID